MTRMRVWWRRIDQAAWRAGPETFPCVVGRDASCELVLEDERVSRRHLAIDTFGSEYVVHDLGSANGTLLNGSPLRGRVPLRPDDRAELGPFAVCVGPDPESVESPVAVDDAESAEVIAQDICAELRAQLRDEAKETTFDIRAHLSAGIERALTEYGLDTAFASRVRELAIAELLGLGPLDPLLRDDSVTEILVNGSGEVYVERRGRLERTEARFVDDHALRRVIERIVTPLGRRIDEASPMVDARLPDGSRVNAIIPPLAIDGPAVTIRKFARQRLAAADLVDAGAMDTAMAELLRAAVTSRCNILVSGGTGAGKTTLLNVLAGMIPAGERIVTIEDAAELRLDQPHVVRLEARPANAEGAGEVPIRALLRNALRMRPDRIVVGECRGAEALDMLQAMNTGHDGGLTTVHANSPRDALARVETMCLMADVGLPHRAIREQVVRAIHVIVQQARFADGARRIVEIAEIHGLEGEQATLHTLSRYDAHGGAFIASGFRPRFLGGAS